MSRSLSSSSTLAHLKHPKPRKQYTRPKLYVIKQQAIEDARSKYKGNEVDGMPKSDIEVLSSMITVSTKKNEVQNEFAIHRNYRALNYMHQLSLHSHNISSLS